MLSSHLRLGLPSGLLPSGLPTKMLYAPLTSPMRATCPAHLILLALTYLQILHKIALYLKKYKHGIDTEYWGNVQQISGTYNLYQLKIWVEVDQQIMLFLFGISFVKWTVSDVRNLVNTPIERYGNNLMPDLRF
jgi:hypothetical protein